MYIPLDPRVRKGLFILLPIFFVAWIFSRPLEFFAFFFLCFHLFFFRDPKRKIPAGRDPVSPADGEVVDISSEFEERYLKEEAVKIGMFLSIFVPHVNRSPAEGTVGYLEYVPGKFLNALNKESVKLNESNWIGIEEGKRRILFRQISGAIARRIHWDIRLGQSVKRGDKVGIICYGSRVECFIPKKDFQLKIRIGDHVKAGETILGEWS